MTHQASHALRLPYHYFDVTQQKHSSDRLKAVLPLWFLLLFLPPYRKFGGFSYWQLRVWFCRQKRTAATVRSRDLTATHSSKQHSEGFHSTESSMLESPDPGLMPWSSSTPTQAVHGVFDWEATVQPASCSAIGNLPAYLQRTRSGFFSSLWS